MSSFDKIKLKWLANLYTGNSIPDTLKDNYTNKSIPYIPTKALDVNSGTFDYDNGLSVNENDGFKIAPKGAVLLCVEGGSAGKKIGVVDRDVAFVNKLCCINANNMNKKLLYYCLQSKDFLDQFFLNMTGLIGGVSISVLKNISITIPVNPQSQKVIANYLDEKCSQVDTLIANQEQQIEKLKAYKQSLITETVTKGLNPNAPMKDSGIEWIGQINADFSVYQISSLFTIKKDIIGKEPDCVLSITQSGIKIKDTQSNEGQNAASYDNYQIVNVGDFAMNHMDLITGWIDISKYNGVTSPDYRVFVIKDTKMISKYFLYVFQSYYTNKVFYGFGQGVSNFGRWRLPAFNFNRISIPVPPIEEQQKIANYLDEQCTKIDALMEIKQQKIAKLTDYKKSLIYEYVTGKKEVI